jgi:hypothetical protein
MNVTHARQALMEWEEQDARQRTGGLVVQDRELAYFLVNSAVGHHSMECNDGKCLVCNHFSAVWWELCNDLAGPTRIRMQRIMREADIPFPNGPWEVVGTHDLPTSRD